MRLTQELHDHYLTHYPADAARLVESDSNLLAELSDVSGDALTQLFENIDLAHLGRLFLSLESSQQQHILETATIRTSIQILSCLSSADSTRILQTVPGSVSEELSKLLEFPEGTAGRFMDRLTAMYRTDQTVGEALEALRQSSSQRVRSLHLVDREGVLAGRVDLQDMALAEPEALISGLLHPIGAVAQLTSSEKDLVELFDRYRVDSIPVVDHDYKLLGVVRYTNLFQAAEDAATASMQRMVGASAEERALSTPLFAVKRRLVWLHINLLTAFAAASVVGLFESTIAQFTALAILLPVVAGQSGNAGSQALAVTMRGLSLKEISTLHWRPVLAKEIQIGFINGVALAITCGLGVFLWSESFGLALVIGIAMVSAMVMAGISGALVPMILLRVGQDPATASSIILTTVTDISGFLVFLGTASLLSSML